MRIALIICVAIILILLTVFYTSTTESTIKEKALKAEAKAFREAADSLDKKYKAKIEQDSILIVSFGNAIQRANNSEQRALKAEQQLKYERSINRRFSDSATDSLLTLIQ